MPAPRLARDFSTWRAAAGVMETVMALSFQTENELPQPQVVCAFGLWITKREPSRPSS